MQYVDMYTFTCLFIYQGNSNKRQRSELFGLRVKLLLVAITCL